METIAQHENKKIRWIETKMESLSIILTIKLTGHFLHKRKSISRFSSLLSTRRSCIVKKEEQISEGDISYFQTKEHELLVRASRLYCGERATSVYQKAHSREY
jgi:hypothetical protein